MEEGVKPLELAKVRKMGFRAALALYPCYAHAVKRNLKSAISLGIFMGESGELDDWTPAALCAALINNAKAAGRDTEIHLYMDAHHSFHVSGRR